MGKITQMPQKKVVVKEPKYFICVDPEREPHVEYSVHEGGGCSTLVIAQTLKEAYRLQEEAIKGLEKEIKIYKAMHEREGRRR